MHLLKKTFFSIKVGPKSELMFVLIGEVFCDYFGPVVNFQTQSEVGLHFLGLNWWNLSSGHELRTEQDECFLSYGEM